MKPPKIKPLAEVILGEIRKERKRVPQSVKTKVYERAKRGGKIGKCEYPGCGKRLLRSEGQFHHWREKPTERTTAFLCYECHKNHGHEHKTKTDWMGREKTVLVPKRIPLKIKTKRATPKKKPKTTKTRRRRRKKR